MKPTVEQFLLLPENDIARLLEEISGPQVCVLPVNGTRRWFDLENKITQDENWFDEYTKIVGNKNVELYTTCLRHGITSLVLPMFGGELLNRSQEYIEAVVNGFSQLATYPNFVSFYEREQVRVHFYGSYREQFKGTKYAYLIEQFDAITKKTASYQKGRIFYGLFADNETEHIAKIAIEIFQNQGRAPTRREMIEYYYGEYIEKANIFIGFEKFNVFDYPLLGWGEESLYFLPAPTLYLTQNQLRKILYDHIYLRPVQDPDYSKMKLEDFDSMRIFYKKNEDAVLGIGEIRGGIWYSKSGIAE